MRDAGNPAFTAANGEQDFSGQSRIASTRVDIGADEFLTDWQAWLDHHLGGPNLPEDGDPDQDDVPNLIEYSQGMNPGRPDAELSPRLTGNGTGYRFEYRKAAGELIYTVQENPTLEGDWNPLAAAEHTDNAGLYWIELPTGATRDFFRLRVTLP